jgi:clan AA aspartic protease
MIRGTVTVGREPVVRLLVRAPNGPEMEVRAVVDTGFTGLLSVSMATAAALGLPYDTGTRYVMADGTELMADVFVAEVEWTDDWRPVRVSVFGDEALLGMRLMAGHKLEVTVVPGGAVTIRPLS